MLEKADHPSVRKQALETMSTFLLYKFGHKEIELLGKIWIRRITMRLWEEPNLEVFIAILSKLSILFREVMMNSGEKDVDLFKDQQYSTQKRYGNLIDFISRYIRPTKLEFIISRICSVSEHIQSSLFFPIICILKHNSEIIASGDKLVYIDDKEFSESDKEISKTNNYQSGPISSETLQEGKNDKDTESHEEVISESILMPPLQILNRLVNEKLMPLFYSGKPKHVFEVGKIASLLSESETTRKNEHMYTMVHSYVALLKGHLVPNTLIYDLLMDILSVLKYIPFSAFLNYSFEILKAIYLVPRGRLELLKKLIALFFHKNSKNYLVYVDSQRDSSNKLNNFVSVGDYLRSSKWFQNLWDSE